MMFALAQAVLRQAHPANSRPQTPSGLFHLGRAVHEGQGGGNNRGMSRPRCYACGIVCGSVRVCVRVRDVSV